MRLLTQQCISKILTQQCVSTAGIIKFILKHLQREVSPISTYYLWQKNIIYLATQDVNSDVTQYRKTIM